MVVGQSPGFGHSLLGPSVSHLYNIRKDSSPLKAVVTYLHELL